MSTAGGTGSTAATTTSSSGAGTKKVEWKKYRPKALVYEDTVLLRSLDEIWADIYRAVGANNEAQQREARVAAYAYAATNGTSREGNYEGVMVAASGWKFPASVVIRFTTKSHIRRFFRANMNESYEALKESEVLVDDERFMSGVVNDGVPAEAYMAKCDWLKDCSLMTPQERYHHDRLFVAKKKAADIARGGSLESVEADRYSAVQGAEDSQSSGTVVATSGRAVW